jgi:hypothetical protein
LIALSNMPAKQRTKTPMQADSVALQRLDSGREAQLLAANVVFVIVAVLGLLISSAGTEKVLPLVQADPRTASRIQSLEHSLSHDPRAGGSAIELAQLYRDAGEFPFSYDTLREAERTGTREPAWRLKLGLAYLQLGKNDDAVRVLREAEKRCERKGEGSGATKDACAVDVRVKLELFGRVARLFKERHIVPYRQRVAADNALLEVLKPVEVDPAKMRPKGPAAPTAPRPATPVPTKPASPR